MKPFIMSRAPHKSLINGSRKILVRTFANGLWLVKKLLDTKRDDLSPPNYPPCCDLLARIAQIVQYLNVNILSRWPSIFIKGVHASFFPRNWDVSVVSLKPMLS